MKNFTVIENVLPKPYWMEIRDKVMHPDLPWYYDDEISIDPAQGNPFTGNPEIIPSYGFSHPLFVEGHYRSPDWDSYKPILYFMAEKSNYSKFIRGIDVFRAKINLQPQVNASTADNFNMPHIDPVFFEQKETNWVFLYYLLDSDGDTFIFNETAAAGCPSRLSIKERVTPKANTGILFRDDMFHASSNPVTSKRRLNINFNLRAAK